MNADEHRSPENSRQCLKTIFPVFFRSAFICVHLRRKRLVQSTNANSLLRSNTWASCGHLPNEAFASAPATNSAASAASGLVGLRPSARRYRAATLSVVDFTEATSGRSER